MTLQNRVTPFGEIVAAPYRGTMMGNRGIIHDPATRTLLRKRWTNDAWIICVCKFKNVRRPVMARQSWTELFFLDEATALSAGHRPCFYCQRQRALAFQAAWAEGNGRPMKAPEMDRVLHGERLDHESGKALHAIKGHVRDLPDGAMITRGDNAFIVRNGNTYRWSWQGYEGARPDGDAMLLTPPSTVRALRAGYRPLMHGF
ncbi:hypothetical protein HQ945_04430 [Phyllobacterium sp. BT25]|uniref:Uncharacterized protein n=1 Tax=Phyllobacterium pellucidum TaxID=2740464 RepID=A0A849VN81_9HYPH|nr:MULTISPECIES: hypothetical protein [Phyllobacterium]NTS30494.1 hypothetical protein [Phyllobacterium pellucidum]UGY10791.1 hypothetical protein LLE51_006385 [Phyllobacterium sp. T1018]SFI58555.1 hypothetical protein SAMN04515648_0630 [Phyllobacterium sp. CL33Tsu]